MIKIRGGKFHKENVSVLFQHEKNVICIDITIDIQYSRYYRHYPGKNTNGCQLLFIISTWKIEFASREEKLLAKTLILVAKRWFTFSSPRLKVSCIVHTKRAWSTTLYVPTIRRLSGIISRAHIISYNCVFKFAVHSQVAVSCLCTESVKGRFWVEGHLSREKR